MNMKTDEQKIYAKENFADVEQLREELFVDRFVGDDFPLFWDRSREIKITYNDGIIVASYGNEVLECTDVFVPIEKIEPIYGIDPNIW